jgi:hypothetical protein
MPKGEQGEEVRLIDTVSTGRTLWLDVPSRGMSKRQSFGAVGAMERPNGTSGERAGVFRR